MTLPRAAVHHSHSRSRNLLSLPLYPSSIVPRRRKKELGRLLCPLGNAFRSAVLLMIAAFSFFVLDLVHTTSVRSAWHVIIPVSGTMPQPASTFMHAPSVAIIDNNHTQPDAQPDAQPGAHPDAHSAASTDRPSDQHPPVEPANSQRSEQPQQTPAAVLEPAQPVESQQKTQSPPASPTPQPSSSPPPKQPSPQKQTTAQQSPTITMENAVQQARLLAQNKRDPADLSNFDQTTALNYFHLHKTGGVSFKERLYLFVTNLQDAHNPDAQPLNILDTCHTSGPARPHLGTEAEWSCDWRTMEQLSEQNRNNIDLVVGHQYWEKGAQHWLPSRDLRYFTVMRHPLHRKISFFYHFFVRNVGKDEQSVALNELIPFLLGKNMPDSPLIRDAGPNYYASRLSSDGFSGFSDHTFVVPKHKAADTVYNSICKLRRKFVFIGLQSQEKASLCMLKKSVAALSKAQGVQNVSGLEVFEEARERMNTGSYSLSAKIVWQKMSEQQRNEFKEVEKVDLAIYKESLNMFDEMVRKFECRHLVQQNDEDSIAM